MRKRLSLLALLAVLWPAVSLAQSNDANERLIAASLIEAEGVALAREQAQGGALVEALATLDRVLARFPRSAAARLDRALVLCRLGDHQGGSVELARLKPKDYPAGLLDQAKGFCTPGRAEASR
ncbi:hypothetical protein [Erythrobacter cryptus]|uniref:hypothetical protein n=1 Tax=Erythrobacter cryptus TaxID=196588 RepID=UPI00048811BC|nr:hypothetical protein [Erythrobacter cryptus]GIX18581.1 MAG: hypothetical protein KatS3mg120_0257 [Erythrobacter sp.]